LDFGRPLRIGGISPSDGIQRGGDVLPLSGSVEAGEGLAQYPATPIRVLAGFKPKEITPHRSPAMLLCLNRRTGWVIAYALQPPGVARPNEGGKAAGLMFCDRQDNPQGYPEILGGLGGDRTDGGRYAFGGGGGDGRAISGDRSLDPIQIANLPRQRGKGEQGNADNPPGGLQIIDHHHHHWYLEVEPEQMVVAVGAI